MVARVNTGYRKGSSGDCLRLVVQMPKDEADAIDGWGIPAGMTSRTSAVRFLLKAGLEAVKAEKNQPSAG